MDPTLSGCRSFENIRMLPIDKPKEQFEGLLKVPRRCHYTTRPVVHGVLERSLPSQENELAKEKSF